MVATRSPLYRPRGDGPRDGRASEPGASSRVDVRGARRPANAAHSSSVALLIELSQEPPIQELLGEFGVHPRTLLELRGELQRALDPEPADWRVRLAQRGAGKLGVSEFDRLLAIARSADCHAYQLLERAGVPCGQLRKRLIERLRERGTASMHRTDQPGARPRPRLSVGGAHPRMSSARELEPRDSDDDDELERASPAEQDRAAPSVAETVAETRTRGLTAVDAAALPELIGREEILGRLADALLRRAPRPPVLVGAHGSGRTLVARHLARLLRAPVFHLLATDYTSDESLRATLERIARKSGVVIFDDLDRVACDVAPEYLPSLSQAWARSAPPVVTVVSHENLARLASWLPGVHEMLDVIALPDPPEAEGAAAVRAAAPGVLAQHGVALGRGAHLAELARLADHYLAGLAMPGRALDLLDLSCARVLREGGAEVTRAHWLDIVCERSGLPRERVDGREGQVMLDLEGHLARRVVGHAHALETLARLIRRNRAGFSSDRPVATALLLGPSGVGKTEIAKALCDALFDRPDALVRLDMSEYAESHAVARIIGAPPGYVGHEHGGALTDPLLRTPHCVVLLDEIEKGHRDVHQLLLQVFDEGRLTDGRGRTVDFRHAVIIMTSNLGAAQLSEDASERAGKRARSRRATEARDERRDDAVLAEARAAFPIELWNRIEAPMVLRPLTRDELARICGRLVRRSSERLFADRGIRYRLQPAACDWLVDRCGEDAALGARPLRHLLSRQVEAMIAESILRGRVRPGCQLEVALDERGEALTLETLRQL
ncbi:MAG: AAA family ATPase [Myxococcales bacterium]|nr:AAA family ATPase [Myxococcales bacterium]